MKSGKRKWTKGEKMSIFNEEPFLIAEIGVNYYDIAKKEKISNMDDTDTAMLVINNIYEGTFFFFENGKLNRISIGSIAE